MIAGRVVVVLLAVPLVTGTTLAYTTADPEVPVRAVYDPLKIDLVTTADELLTAVEDTAVAVALKYLIVVPVVFCSAP